MIKNIEQTVFFVKPEDLHRGPKIYEYLFKQLAGSDLIVAERKFTTLTYEQWKEFYVHLQKTFPKELEKMAQDYANKEIDLSLLEGQLITERIKNLVGPTIYEQNPSYTIRGHFGPYTLPHTIVHASETGEAEREIALLKKYGAIICKT
jgi:nucleoside diphosphate kinase